MTDSFTYLERYKRGEHQQVWDELVALGAGVREEPVYTDALAVSYETMRRARQNIELLIPRLRDMGYAFGHGWAIGRGDVTPESAAEMDQEEPPLSPPDANVGEAICELERRAGTLPLSLRAFYEVVGGCNFVGAHPAWESHRLDPLEVLSVPALLRLDDWNHWSDDRRDDGTCEVPICPDEFFKYLYSGGGPYAIPVPPHGLVADAPLLYEWHDTTVVNYLRICFQWGGLPGWSRMEKRPDAGLAYLIEGLLPICVACLARLAHRVAHSVRETLACWAGS